MTLVTDASALIEILLRTETGDRARELLAAAPDDIHVPALCDIEVAAGIRRGLRAGRVTAARSAEAIEDYLDLPLTRHGHQALLGRVLTLRENFSAYDATYVALAERLGAELLTADARLARAVASHTDVALAPS